jgi:hypothetical protein
MPHTLRRVRLVLEGFQFDCVLAIIEQHIKKNLRGYRTLESLEIRGVGDALGECKKKVADTLPEAFGKIVTVVS